MAGQCSATAFVSPHSHRPLFNQIQAMHACTHAAARKRPAKRPALNQHPCTCTSRRERTALVGRKSSRHACKVLWGVLGLRSAVDDGLPLHKRTLACESASSGHLDCERRSTCESSTAIEESRLRDVAGEGWLSDPSFGAQVR